MCSSDLTLFPCLRLRLLPGLGQRPGHADAGRAGEGRSHGDLRRVRRGGHGPDRGPDGDGRVPGPAGGHRPGPVQPGVAVLHGGQHGSHEVPQGAVGRRISDGVKKIGGSIASPDLF